MEKNISKIFLLFILIILAQAVSFQSLYDR